MQSAFDDRHLEPDSVVRGESGRHDVHQSLTLQGVRQSAVRGAVGLYREDEALEADAIGRS